MESFRLPRFKRAASVPSIQLTERDGQIIRLIHQHRFLRSPQIVALLEAGAQPILRRLQLLYHHGYLERPRAQIEYFQKGGSRHIVYGLGNKGAAFLKRTHAAIGKVVWGAKNRSVGRIFLEHALLVSDIMVAIELGCRENGQIRFLSENELQKQSGKRKSFHWKVNVNNRLKLGVIPDRVFGLEFQNEKGERTRAYFFLEADRGTMPVTRKNLHQTSFFRKMLAYEATWSQSIHRTQFGFHRFRVLAVTTSAERVNSLIAACSQLKRGQGLFLFADKSILEHPVDILAPILKTARPGITGSLLD